MISRFSYVFPRSQCLQDQFSDAGGGNVLGYLLSDTTGSNCINSDGVGGPGRIRSVNSVSNLKASLGKKDITIELWVQPAVNLTSDAAIFSLGVDSTGASGCRNNLVVMQLAGSKTNSNLTSYLLVGCNALSVSTGMYFTSPTVPIEIIRKEAKLHHLVMQLRFTTTTLGLGNIVYEIGVNYTINGNNGAGSFRSTIYSGGGFDASSWDNSAKLNVFSKLDASNAVKSTPGHVHKIALYNSSLNHASVVSMYAARLPNSIPVVTSIVTSVQENGEVGDHSFQPEFYNSVIPALDLATISLNVSDLENYAYGVPSVGARPQIIVTSLPTGGSTLYQYDGTIIITTNVRIPFDIASNKYRLRIRPPLDKYSASSTTPLDSFTFVAIDGVTGLQSTETARVDVIVTHVDKPPIALRRSQTIVYGGYKELVMNGTDPDSAIVGAIITKNPTNGVLYQYATYRTVNATTNAYTLQSGPPFHVWYEYTGPRTVDANNRVGGDSFQFCLVDVEGRRSVPVTYTVSVLSPIYSRAVVATTASPKGVEDARAAVTLRGGDTSVEKNYLWAYIVTTPKMGKLYKTANLLISPITGLDLLIGSIAPGNYTLGGINVFYQGPANYFTTPTKTWNGTLLNRAPDSFTFKIQAASGGDSLPVTQFVHIKNVNDPSVLFVSAKTVQMRVAADVHTDTTSTTLLSASNTTDSTTFNATDPIVYTASTTPGSVTLSGFSVLDPDLGVDPVHITVATLNASTFRLNSNYLNAVDFNSATYCKSATVSWWCEGDGTVTKASFVAAPSDAVKVLNGMTLTLGDNNVEDTVVVTMYDGVGGNCMSVTQLGTGSIYSGCYSTAVSVKVYGSGTSSIAGSGNGAVSSELMTRLMYVGIGMAVFIALVAWRFFASRKSRLKRNSDDDTDDKPTFLTKIRLTVFGSSAPARATSARSRSPGRTPKRTAQRRRGRDSESGEEARSGDESSDSEDSGSRSESETDTEEEKYDDVEAGRASRIDRTPPRRSQQQSRPTSPRTPKISTPIPTSPERNVRHESFPNPCDRSRGEIPTETIIIYSDRVGPNGQIVTEETRVVVPMFPNGDNSTPVSTPTKKGSSSRRGTPLKAFPDMQEDQAHSTPRSSASKPPLGRAPSCNTSPLRTSRLPGKRPPNLQHLQELQHMSPQSQQHQYPYEGLRDYSDQTVSTMTCSVSPPPPPLRVTPQHRAVATPESEYAASPMRTNSPSKHSPRSRRDNYQYRGDGSEIDALTQHVRTPERITPHKRTGDRSGGQSVRSGASEQYEYGCEGVDVSESGTKRSSSTKKSKARGERSADRGASGQSVYSAATGVSIGNGVWSEHIHRSGRTFYHNSETGKNTWRKPAEAV